MSQAYGTAGWENFFFAEVGASAALVGLLFVAVSINLSKILEYPSLPGRAFEGVVVLVMVLLVATFALVPGQSTTALGAEILGTALVCWCITLVVQTTHGHQANLRRSWVVSRIAATQIATLPMIVAGASLLAGRGGGLYWAVFGVAASFVAALVDAWVLLVEIHR
jgi:hypothetical protein